MNNIVVVVVVVAVAPAARRRSAREYEEEERHALDLLKSFSTLRVQVPRWFARPRMVPSGHRRA
jgi:hypothetical protein